LKFQTVFPAAASPSTKDEKSQKVHPTKQKNLEEFDFEIVDIGETVVTDKNIIKIPIYESTLYIDKIIKKDVPIPGWTRTRLFYTGSGVLYAKQAIEIASRRNPSIGKTTIFQEPSEFWLCHSSEKYGEMEVVISPMPGLH
jgi:hypothetical protein